MLLELKPFHKASNSRQVLTLLCFFVFTKWINMCVWAECFPTIQNSITTKGDLAVFLFAPQFYFSMHDWWRKQRKPGFEAWTDAAVDIWACYFYSLHVFTSRFKYMEHYLPCIKEIHLVELVIHSFIVDMTTLHKLCWIQLKSIEKFNFNL